MSYADMYHEAGHNYRVRSVIKVSIGAAYLALIGVMYVLAREDKTFAGYCLLGVTAIYALLIFLNEREARRQIVLAADIEAKWYGGTPPAVEKKHCPFTRMKDRWTFKLRGWRSHGIIIVLGIVFSGLLLSNSPWLQKAGIK